MFFCPALNAVKEPRPLSEWHFVLTVIYFFEREIRHELLPNEPAGLWILDDPNTVDQCID